MIDKSNHSNGITPRENFLMSILSKVIKEYKALLEHTRRNKPFKIVEILNLSKIPGETKFTIQVTYKNSLVHLSAAEIINANYNLNDFSDFHAEMIRQAAQGKLIEFLKLSEEEPEYKIVSKRMDTKLQQYIFTIENKNGIRFDNTAEELSRNKNLLSNIGMQDIYDIGYTQGTESILKEKYFASGDSVESVGFALLLRTFLIVLAGKPIRLDSSSAFRRASAISRFKFLLNFSDIKKS